MSQKIITSISSSTAFSEFASQLLWQECYDGGLTLVKLNELIAQKADINYQNPDSYMNSCVYNIFKHTGLYDTFEPAHWEHERTVRLFKRLVELKADFNLPNTLGNTAAHLAIVRLHYESVPFLLPHLNFLKENNQGIDSIEAAIKPSFLEGAIFVLEKTPINTLSIEKIKKYQKELYNTYPDPNSGFISSASKKNSQQILGELLDKLFIQVEQLNLNQQVANSLGQCGALNISSIGSADKLTQKFKI